jgi:hypothetical protein
VITSIARAGIEALIDLADGETRAAAARASYARTRRCRTRSAAPTQF